MKRFLILPFIFSVAILSSCNKDKNGPEMTSNSDFNLPTKAVTYIDDNYPDAIIDNVVTMTGNEATYIVTLNTAEELAFDNDGGFLGNGEEFHGGQPQCDTIYGGYHGGPHHGGIPIDSLSAAIKDYVAANYAGYNIQHANHENFCPIGTVTFVMIGMPETQPIGLVFGTADEFLMTRLPVAYDEVPQAVRDYIAVKYPEYQAEERSEMLSLADGSQDYLVHLKKHHGNKIVHMTSDGTFLCEQ